MPVALLSFCGIMPGIGSSLSRRDVLTLTPLLNHPPLQFLLTWMAATGAFAFRFLPVMFALRFLSGLTRGNTGVAAFACAVSI